MTAITEEVKDLDSIIDFQRCRYLVEEALRKRQSTVILCPKYTELVENVCDDKDALAWDREQLNDTLGFFTEVNDMDELIVNLINLEDD